MYGNLLFDKVKFCRSATSLKANLQRKCFLENFRKFGRTPFLQNTTGRLLLIKIVTIVVKGELANKTVNYAAQKMKFSIKDFFSKCDQIHRKLVTFTEEALHGKLHFLCSIMVQKLKHMYQFEQEVQVIEKEQSW